MDYQSVPLFSCKEGSGDPPPRQALYISDLQLEAAVHLDISYLIGWFLTLEIFWYCYIKRWKHSTFLLSDVCHGSLWVHHSPPPYLIPNFPLLWLHFKGKGERELYFTHFFDDQTAENNPSQNDFSKVAASKYYVPWKKQEAERLKFKFSNPVVSLMDMWTSWDRVFASSILTANLPISWPLPLHLWGPVPLQCWRLASKPFISEQRGITRLTLEQVCVALPINYQINPLA